jgi:hypothetical protein
MTQRITLRNIKARGSKFSADVLFDGQRVATVASIPHGAAPALTPAAGLTHEDLRPMREWVFTQSFQIPGRPAMFYSIYNYTCYFESLVREAAEA